MKRIIRIIISAVILFSLCAVGTNAAIRINDYIYGDVDGSGEVDAVDATVIQRYVLGFELPHPLNFLMLGDIDDDGELTIVDATSIQRYATHIAVPYPLGKVEDYWIWPLPGIYTLPKTFEKTGCVYVSAYTGTPVYAAQAGTVKTANNSCTHSAYEVCDCCGGYGNYVWISHEGGCDSIYGYLIATTVSEGDKVSKGQLIGYVGSTGYATASCLLFEVRNNGVKIDPLSMYK